MTRVADTSALYAFFDRDDGHHPLAIEAVEEDDPIVVPAPILVELAGLLERRHGWMQARDAVTYLLGLPHLSIAEGVEMEAVVRVFEGADGDLSLADAVVVQTCRVFGADPLTFDASIRDAAA